MYTIRKGVKEDCEGIAELAEGLNQYYSRPHPIKYGPKELERLGFCDNIDKRKFETFVAELNDTKELIGFTMFFDIFTTWGGEAVYMEDLFVKKKYRGSGAGGDLLRALAKHTYDKGYDRLDWATDNWNVKTIAFYKHMGGVDMYEKEKTIPLRMHKEEIEKLAKSVQK